MISRFSAVVFATLVAAVPLAAQDVDEPARLSDGLEVAAPGRVGLSPAPLLALNQALVEESFPNTTSVLVLKDGKLVFERYFFGGGRDVLNDTRRP